VSYWVAATCRFALRSAFFSVVAGLLGMILAGGRCEGFFFGFWMLGTRRFAAFAPPPSG